MPTNWQQKADAEAAKMANPQIGAANADMVRRVVAGKGPDKNAPDPALGARAVANIAAVHVPAFCKDRYKNAYDLGKVEPLDPGQFGSGPPGQGVPLRALVDSVLSDLTKAPEEDTYFLAMEVNGTGIRFYGDICLVLRSDATAAATVVLDRNSYDLARPPLAPTGTPPTVFAMSNAVADLWGRWKDHSPDMAVLKTFALRPDAIRRFTTGQISEAILQDEDYLEVLRIGSFDHGDLQEARVSAPDAAAEAQIGEQLRTGPCPSLAELQWRKHRKQAVCALAGKRIATRVVTTEGRTRS